MFKDRDYPSAMTFPRRLVWRDGALSTPVIETVETLRRPEPAVGIAADGQAVTLTDGLAEIEISLAEKGAPFDLAFRHPEFGLALNYADGKLELGFKAPGSRPSPRYFIEDIAPESLRIFVDVGLIEIYVDDGRWCLTKRIDSDAPIEAITLTAAPGTIGSARLHHLRPQGA